MIVGVPGVSPDSATSPAGGVGERILPVAGSLNRCRVQPSGHHDVVSPDERCVIEARRRADNRNAITRLEIIGQPSAAAAQTHPAGHLGSPLLRLAVLIDDIENDIAMGVLGQKLHDHALYPDPLIRVKERRIRVMSLQWPGDRQKHCRKTRQDFLHRPLRSASFTRRSSSRTHGNRNEHPRSAFAGAVRVNTVIFFERIGCHAPGEDFPTPHR